ncbi:MULTISPECIES: amino acid ABC transporter permease [Agrobacterium]|uniref:Amino acid ABC transporter permease n=1 Tax=Agrobacterium tumefaciens TaxID=358 RepID=A0AAE6EEE1_AGRTU|nr:MULTISPECIES: amino acid ABC transporter permease [Agrobacterium]QCL73043.1 amino acid ABC transporter permease [Agrobacterium tumefaciens]QCL78620.1 amino acid ABC transporter permease [Agrobacterium tumefaciens]CUX48105.1 putative ABC-type amino acid transporter, membrane spanning protein [Agrobacterium sp. NCPPB 925]
MNFSLHFEAVFAESDMIWRGIMLTIGLSATAIVLGTMIAVALVAMRSLGNGAIRFGVDSYVELLRNTPFLVQLFMVFFGLPLVGFRMSGTQAALFAMTLNLSAYATEIIRAGVESIHRSQVEAGLSLSLSRLQVFRYVVMKPAFAKIWPALSSQFVLMLLASSICSFISVPELSGAASIIEQRTFRSFETYIVVTVIYLLLALALKIILAWLGHWLFRRRVTVLSAMTVKEGIA